MSHHGHLACDASVSWRSARVARAQAICGPPLDSPPGEKSQGNLDALTVTMMSHLRLLASDVIDCGRFGARVRVRGTGRLSAAPSVRYHYHGFVMR